MRKIVLFVAATLVCLSPALTRAEGQKVPAGKENLTLEFMSKAKAAAGRKVLKGPVPFAHQAHVDRGVGCPECHHKQPAGEAPKPCFDCHKDTTQGEIPKLNDAFHGGEGLPPLQSCVGCHQRKVAKMSSPAPAKREPCEACHSILKKK